MITSSLPHSTVVRPLKTNDLKMILQWRNDPHIRKFMYSQHEIDLQEHLTWFESASANPLRYLLIYQEDDHPRGYINITKHASEKIADWGFYLAPNAPKGTGKRLGKAALNYAFTTLLLHKVCGEVIGYNKQSINFHINQGFQQEGILRDQYFDGEHFYSIFCFGLLKREWDTLNEATNND